MIHNTFVILWCLYLDNVKYVDPFFSFSDGFLWVAQYLETDPDRYSNNENVVLFFIRWDIFCDTRWGGVGPSARSCILCAMVGVDGLAEYVVANSEYEQSGIGGYLRFCKLDVRYFLFIAHLIIYPIELQIIYCPIAFFFRYKQIMQSIHEDVEFLSRFPMAIWDTDLQAELYHGFIVA